MLVSKDDREFLLSVAREAIERAARGRSAPEVDLEDLSDLLRERGASFVTLTKRGRLRGCIGSLERRRPLAIDVRENAVAAAMNDPRFPPVQPQETGDLRVEISVLSEPEPLEFEGGDELLEKLRPGVDGVVLERGWNRATFLPQVWEKLPEPRQFLQHLCQKAYLPADAYKEPGVEIYTYQVEKFKEDKGGS